VSLYKRGETYWIYIRHNGRRIRESARTADRREAQRYHDERRAELWAETHQQESAGLTWLQACAKWLKAAPRSASDRYSLRSLDYADRPLADCTRESFEAALAGKSAATFNRYRATIQAILHLEDVRINIPLKKTKSRRLRFLTRDEWDRLYAELPDHLKPLAAFALATGLRQKNVTHLTWEQIDLRRKVAWIHPDQAKAGKPIGIPLSQGAINILEAQRGQHKTWVFTYRDRPIGKIKPAWQLAMERAGLGHFERKLDKSGKLISKRWIGDFTWHGLRHTWAAWHVMNGTPLHVLQKLGGWESEKMVQVYAHLAPEYLAGYADNAKPWDNGRAAA
jgi:integrase